MSTVPETEYVAAGDVQPGDKLLYADLVVEVAAWPLAASWHEGGQQVHGVEIECRDVSGNSRLSFQCSVVGPPRMLGADEVAKSRKRFLTFLTPYSSSLLYQDEEKA